MVVELETEIIQECTNSAKAVPKGDVSKAAAMSIIQSFTSLQHDLVRKLTDQKFSQPPNKQC